MTPDHTRHVLANGLRIIAVENPALHSFVCHARIHAGPRFETRADVGLTHFLEHMLFQGTENLPTPHSIMCAIEDVGGVLDAATHTESLEVSVGVHRRHRGRCLDVLAEILLRPLFEPHEIEQEKHIVEQELAEYRDADGRNISASELAFSLMFREGADDLGTRGSAEIIRSFDVERVRAQYERFVVPSNLVITVAGAFDAAAISGEIAERFGAMPCGTRAAEIIPSEVGRRRARSVYRPSEQLPVVDVELCHRAWPLGDPRSDALRAGIHILGGGLGSRLFHEVREERGLVYEIYSFGDFESDGGSMGTVLSASADRVVDAFDATLGVMDEARRDGVRADELERFKETVRCGMEIMCDRPTRVADWYGRQELLLAPETIDTPAQYAARMERLTREDVTDVLRAALAPDATALAVVGPFEGDDRSAMGALFPAEEARSG